MRRALERAGNRLKGRAGTLRSTLSTTPAMRAAAVAGPNLIADAGFTSDELLEGAWEDVVVRYRKWTGAAYDEATGVVSGVIGEWRTGYPAAMKGTFASHLDESEAMLRRGLQGIAAEKMLDPKGLDEVGELVPNGFVRHVVARAGGTTDITSTGYAYVSLTADGGPLPGLATGPLLEEALHDHGAVVHAFRWVYGPAFRQSPFRPHARLDGVVFSNFDDEKLRNTTGFPAVSFYIPGDHRGCRCDAEPIVLTPEQAAALGLASPSDETPAQRRRRERSEAREASLLASAVEHNVDVDSVRAHLGDVKALRRAIAADAAATQERAHAVLSRGALNKALLPRPPRVGTPERSAGEWDWLRGLSQEERSRLSRSWYLDGPDVSSIDTIAEMLQAEGAASATFGVSEVMERVWLPLNRQLEAAGQVRRGKMPVAKHYSERVNVNDLAPNVNAEGIDVAYVLSHTDDEVAGMLASRASYELEDHAYRALGGRGSDTPDAPWRMTFQSWETEVRDLEWTFRNAPDEVTRAMRVRYDQLVPSLLDEPGLDHESLYSVIVETARVGKLEVPASSRIPWLAVDDIAPPPGYLDELVRAGEAAEAAQDAGAVAAARATGLPYDLTAAAPRIGQRGWSDFINGMVEEEVDGFRAGWRPNSEIGDGIVKIRMGEDGLTGVLESGRLLSQHDVGRSGGVFDPAGRLAHEAAMFGDLEHHPIYGRIDDAHFGGKESQMLPMYGNYEIELKAGVADRTSITIGDSLIRSNPPAPMALLDVADADRSRVRDAWATEDLTRRFLQGSSYVEAQVHGGVSLDDIAAVVVPPGEGYWTGPLAERLRSLGITVKQRERS